MSREDKIISDIKQYIKRDLYDDFWKDVINYEDLLEDDVILPKSHQPSHTKVIDIPKESKVLRPGHYISFLDRVYYFRLLLNFCYRIDKKLSKKDVSYSYRLSSSSSKDFIENNIDKWLAFSERQKTEFANHPDWLMIETDITAFFEHIVIAKLITRINIYIDYDTNDLKKLLNRLYHNQCKYLYA